MHLKSAASSDDECDEEFLFSHVEKPECYLSNGHQSKMMAESSTGSSEGSTRPVKVDSSVWRHSYSAHLALSRARTTSPTSVSAVTSQSSEKSGSVENLVLRTRKWLGGLTSLNGNTKIRSQSLNILDPLSPRLDPGLGSPYAGSFLEMPSSAAASPLRRKGSFNGALKRRIRSLSSFSLGSSEGSASARQSNTSLEKRTVEDLLRSASSDSKLIDSSQAVKEPVVIVPAGPLFQKRGSRRIRPKSLIFRHNLTVSPSGSEYPLPRGSNRFSWFGRGTDSSDRKIQPRPLSAPHIFGASSVAVSFSGSPSSAGPEKGEFRPRVSSSVSSSSSSIVLASFEVPQRVQQDLPQEVPQDEVTDGSLKYYPLESSSTTLSRGEPRNEINATDENIIKGILTSEERVVRRNKRLPNRRSFVPRLSSEIILEADPSLEGFESRSDNSNNSKNMTYEDFVWEMKQSLVNGSLDALATSPETSTPLLRSSRLPSVSRRWSDADEIGPVRLSFDSTKYEQIAKRGSIDLTSFDCEARMTGDGAEPMASVPWIDEDEDHLAARRRTCSEPLPSHWRTSDASRSHFPGAPEGQTRNSPNMEQRDSEIVEKNGDGICAMSVASDENDMGRNKNFRSHSAWDLRRPWSQSSCHRPDGNHLLIRKSSLESESPVACSRSSSPAPSTGSEGVLQKFRKSFSLRFHRRMAKPSDSTLPGADAQTDSRLRDEDDTDSTFRFGPITWRASKDRKRTKKAASNRNSKCNSGDSGIQVTRPPSTDFESLGFVNEFPPTVTAGSPEDDARRQPRHYPLGGSATAPQSPADVASALWTNTVPDRSREESCFGSGRLRRTVSQPLRNEQPEEQEARRPSPEGCEVDFGVGYSSEDELETDRVTQTYEERPLDPLSSRDEGEALIAKALYDHTSVEPQELSFQKGDIFVITGFKDSEWWYGHISSAVGTGNASAVREEIQGWVPASFVKVTSRQEVEDADRKHFRTAAHLRSNVVNEILGTERDYVKHLEDIVEGYLDLMRQREDMFSPEQIVTIFRNIRPLFEFQKRFLRDLEASYSKETPHETCVGSCFLRHLSSFEVYSDYCTQQGAAIAELQSLCANDQKNQFLEGCRLLRGMRDIDLNGFLLKPVQRICQYHLQLEELRKRTDDNHSDHNDVNLAFHSMKGVANRINERTRQLQEMERLNQWQKMVEGWQGDNLTVKSSQVIYSGDVQKISHGGWAKDVTLYLFDRQAIICRKDLIKRNSLTYKARFSTEEGCEAVEVPDGKDTQYSTTVKFAFKVQDSSKKSYLFTCRTVKDRDKWIEEFRRDRRIQQGEEHRSLPDGASFDSMRRLESKGSKSANERPRLRHIKARPRVKKPDPVSVLPLQDVNADGSTIRVDSSRNRTWFSKTKKRNNASSSEA